MLHDEPTGDHVSSNVHTRRNLHFHQANGWWSGKLQRNTEHFSCYKREILKLLVLANPGTPVHPSENCSSSLLVQKRRQTCDFCVWFSADLT